MIQDRAHRYSWEIHKGPIPEGLFVLHSCDVPACVNPSHLFLGNNQENVDDMMNKGRHVSGGTYIAEGDGNYERGENHHGAKLDASMVRLIRKAREDGASFGEIAKQFNLAVGHVFRIVNRKAWEHVE